MKLGIFSWYGYRSSMARRLDLIRDAGFDSTMLWGGPEEKDSLATATQHASSIGLEVENLHIPFEDANTLWADNHEIRKSFMAKTIGFIYGCRDVGIPMIVMHISRGYDIEQPNQLGLETLSAIVDAAQQHQITVAIENTRKGNLIESLLNHIPNENLGLCYDTSHGKLYEESEFYLLKKYSHRLKCLHISDNDGIEDKHWKIGQGKVDWDRFVEAFPRHSYDGTLSLEVYPWDSNEREEEHLSKAYRGLSTLRERIALRTS
jgi:sugar phosphate isomerase/epimerase